MTNVAAKEKTRKNSHDPPYLHLRTLPMMLLAEL